VASLRQIGDKNLESQSKLRRAARAAEKAYSGIVGTAVSCAEGTE
jgi:hypothetical protein